MTNEYNGRPIPVATDESTSPLSGETKQPKRVIAGTGDPQQDAVDSIGAGVNAVRSIELVARAIYQLMWPTLSWPEGNTKRAKEARQSAMICAERILERIGREQYQQALDACHLLLTKPSRAEDEWIAGAKTLYGLTDLVTKKVSNMRAEDTKRPIFDVGDFKIDPALDAVWQQVAAEVHSKVPSYLYKIWMQDAKLLCVIGDTCLVRLGTRGGEASLRPYLERELSRAMERHIEVVFEGE